jgi:predicted SnoaL-like aldol condensation-catalyzing enzyme
MKKTLTAAAAGRCCLPPAPLPMTPRPSKPIVGAFLGAVLQGDVDTMREVANADYIQHNPFIPTGLEPFIELLPVLAEAGTTWPKTSACSKTATSSSCTTSGAMPSRSGPPRWCPSTSSAWTRTEGRGTLGCVAAPRDGNRQRQKQTDGPTEVTDLDQTEANKALAVALIEDVLMGRDPAKITDYISAESYAQHNPGIADGLDGIVAAVEALTAQGNMFQYTEIHAVLGEGNFVLTVSEGQWNGTTNAFYDLFRMEDGMIVEHWDVIQPVPTEGLANTNGMFTGFDGVGPDSIGE